MSRLKTYALLAFISLFFLFISLPSAFSWGFHAHKMINHEAVYALPMPLEAFYKKNIDYVGSHAGDPDKRKHYDSAEGSKHFINIDHYGPKAFDELPKYWKAAVQKYTEDTINKYGSLPWTVLYWEAKLTEDFKNKDTKGILKASAYIGHYIGDAHVPLHTVSNFNGQMSEQEGVHALWETAIPEMYSVNYKLVQGKVNYIKDPEARIFEIVKQSYDLAPVLLAAEKNVSKDFSEARKYTVSRSGEKKQYSPEYISAYNKALNGMVEKQMQSSAMDVAAFWYTAWVNAGQPDLVGMVVK